MCSLPSLNQSDEFPTQLSALFNDREIFLQMKRKEHRSREDDFIRHKRDLERQMAQLKREADLPRNQNKPATGESELENLRVGYQKS